MKHLSFFLLNDSLTTACVSGLTYVQVFEKLFQTKSPDDVLSADDDIVTGETNDYSDHSILVPLEFSGGTTRVLTDPGEIKEIQCHEMERYYHRKYVRLFIRFLMTNTRRAISYA